MLKRIAESTAKFIAKYIFVPVTNFLRVPGIKHITATTVATVITINFLPLVPALWVGAAITAAVAFIYATAGSNPLEEVDELHGIILTTMAAMIVSLKFAAYATSVPVFLAIATVGIVVSVLKSIPEGNTLFVSYDELTTAA